MTNPAVVNAAQARDIWNRVVTSRKQQFAPTPTEERGFSGTGQVVDVLRARGKRHTETKPRPGGTPRPCLFCETRGTPSTLFEATMHGRAIVPVETASFAAADSYLSGRSDQELAEIGTYYGLAAALAEYNTPADPDAAVRAFLNLTPALAHRGDEACVVVGLAHPEFHGRDLPDLPHSVVRAFVVAMQVLEVVAGERGLTSVAFMNRGRMGGATVACPHIQAYLEGGALPLYEAIARHSEARASCGLCETLTMDELTIWENASFRLQAHPAPHYNWSLWAAPKCCGTSRLGQMDAGDLADTLTAAVSVWRAEFGEVPDHNIVLRSGGPIGHAHIEFVPRAVAGEPLNTPAGRELATGRWVITVPPERVAEWARERAPEWVGERVTA